jgi:hypothetical protein
MFKVTEKEVQTCMGEYMGEYVRLWWRALIQSKQPGLVLLGPTIGAVDILGLGSGGYSRCEEGEEREEVAVSVEGMGRGEESKGRLVVGG